LSTKSDTKCYVLFMFLFDEINLFFVQESLKKNLPYVPHKGPLAKFQDTAKQAFHERLKNVKNPKIKTR